MDEYSLRGPVVVDDFLSADACHDILQRFPSLPPEKRQIRCDIRVPEEVKRRISDIVEWCIMGDDPSEMDFKPISAAGTGGLESVLLGKVSVGSSRAFHQDTRFNANGQFEETTIDGYVAVLYLDGDGKLVFDSGSGETTVMLKPGRLVVWLNESCMHRVESPADGRGRRLLGPMYISPEGLVQAVGHMGTLVEQARGTYKLEPPEPKPDVAITVSRDGKWWCCNLMSGVELTRVEVDGPALKRTKEEIESFIAEALPDKDVNIVLLDASGNSFEPDVDAEPLGAVLEDEEETPK